MRSHFSGNLGIIAMDPVLAERQAELLRALAHPVRLRIAAHLALVGEETVGQLSELFGLPQSTVSRHLAGLRLLGIVRRRGSGGFRHYSLSLPQVRHLLLCMSRHLKPGAEAPSPLSTEVSS